MYFITAMTNGPITKDWRSRTFGYFKTLDRALLAVEKNEGEMFECLYTRLVIEPLPEGIYPSVIKDNTNDNLWFKWVHDGGKPDPELPNLIIGQWQRIEKCPEEFKHICGFAM